MEPIRPLPVPTARERIAAVVEFVRPSRIVAMAVSVAVVAVGAWWLLKAPQPPVEESLPLAGRTSVAAAPPTAVPAGGPVAADATVAHAGSAPPSSNAEATAATVIVQVAGAVSHPGVYPIRVGGRVNDVIAAAGGPTADGDPDQINLAAVVTDGERVYVPRVGEIPPTTTRGPSASRPAGQGSAAAGPIDINAATAGELDELPGIGPATAAAIVAHRDQHGPFGSVDDLLDVRGIGPAKLDGFRSLVTT